MKTLVIDFRLIFCIVWGLMASEPARAEELIERGAELKKLASGMKFTEGPVWIPKSNKLVFSDIPNSKLMQWTEARGLEVYLAESEQTNGNILDLEGNLISCRHRARDLVRTNSAGELEVLANKFEGKTFNSPNDVAIKSDGSLWFTDPPWGLKGEREIPGNWVYCRQPDGKITVVSRELAMPNGINFSPDETRFYVADTGGHQLVPDPALRNAPAKVHIFKVNPDNTVSKLPEMIDAHSDGMCVDQQGNLYTTTAKGIEIFDREGQPAGIIPVPEQPANVTFGGTDYKTLFITARTSLYSIQMAVSGAKPPLAKW